jgi:hypothetical protein
MEILPYIGTVHAIPLTKIMTIDGDTVISGYYSFIKVAEKKRRICWSSNQRSLQMFTWRIGINIRNILKNMEEGS